MNCVKNIYGEQVYWKYEKLMDCFETMDKIEQGAVVYSRHILCPKGRERQWKKL